MKIHKDDCNGENNGVALGQANILKVQNFGEASYTTYDIINKTEYPTYYNFQLKKGNLDASGSGIYSTVENYFITASRTSSYNMNIRSSASQCVPVFVEPYITQIIIIIVILILLLIMLWIVEKILFIKMLIIQGINTPVNFAFLISGSAEKFPIPDSHYTQKSSTIPRYEGAKSTSQKLNTWTKGTFRNIDIELMVKYLQ
jgi:hypothetical protein